MATTKRRYPPPGIHFTPEEERWMQEALARFERAQNAVDPERKEGRIRRVSAAEVDGLTIIDLQAEQPSQDW